MELLEQPEQNEPFTPVETQKSEWRKQNKQLIDGVTPETALIVKDALNALGRWHTQGKPSHSQLHSQVCAIV